MGNSSSTTEEDISFGTGDPRPKTRRIVKASVPTPTPTAPDENVDNNDAITPPYYSKSPHIVPKVIAENPSVARELVREQQEENRKERILDMTERQRAKKERILQERRHNNNRQLRDDLPQANPFSRFLSRFSVEQHTKRSYESSTDEDIAEPLEKRVRTDDTIVDGNEKASSSFSVHVVTATAIAVGAAAILLAAYLRRQK